MMRISTHRNVAWWGVAVAFVMVALSVGSGVFAADIQSHAAALTIENTVLSAAQFKTATTNGESFTTQLWRTIFLRDYNTRVVVLGTMLLGIGSGVIGSFLLLRKRALMGDALSHATLPGIAIAFIMMEWFFEDGKSLPGLLVGAFVFGTLGIVCVVLIRNFTRIKEDAALGIVLSVFFGLGVAIMGVIQSMGTGHAAGLESFIYGKTASMLFSDAVLIASVAGFVALLCILLYKEFTLVCFDAQFAGSLGWPVISLDIAMMALAIVITVVGLQAVGLILMLAFLVIPPAAARFWTNDLSRLVVFSAAIGAISGFVGAAMSALVPRLPAGAIIVVVASLFFLISMIFGRRRGVLARLVQHWQLSRKVAEQNLLRALFELGEPTYAHALEKREVPAGDADVPFRALLDRRVWSSQHLMSLVESAKRKGLVRATPDDRYALTRQGLDEAVQVVRNHRLWELYLITHADVAAGQVDRAADRIEHVLGASMVCELESLLSEKAPHLTMPASPHVLVRSRQLSDAHKSTGDSC